MSVFVPINDSLVLESRIQFRSDTGYAACATM